MAFEINYEVENTDIIINGCYAKVVDVKLTNKKRVDYCIECAENKAKADTDNFIPNSRCYSSISFEDIDFEQYFGLAVQQQEQFDIIKCVYLHAKNKEGNFKDAIEV